MLILDYKSRSTAFIQTISAAIAQKTEKKQQHQNKVSAYSFVRLPEVCNGLCQPLEVFPVRSHALLLIPRRSCELLCVIYASKLDSVGHY